MTLRDAAASLDARLAATTALDFDYLAARNTLASIEQRIALLEAELAPADFIAPDSDPVIAALVAPQTAQPMVFDSPPPPPVRLAIALGRFETQALAEMVWAELQAASPSALAGLKPTIVASGGGIMLRGGPIVSAEDGEKRCAQLAEAGAECTLASRPVRAVSAPVVTASEEVGG